MIEIHFGEKNWRTDSSRGHMYIHPAAWLQEKGSLRDFRKILKLCQESDRNYGTFAVAEWREVLEAEPVRIRQKATEVAKDYSQNCTQIRKYYDDPGLPVEKKREALQEMDRQLKKEEKYYKAAMKHLKADLDKAQKLLQEVIAYAG